MAGIRLIRQDDFTGGLNLRADQFQLAPNESPRMLNVEIDPRGGVFSRGAMRSVCAAVTGNWNPERLFAFNGPTPYAMLTTGYEGATNGKVYYSTGSTFTALTPNVSDVNGASFAPWGSTLYCVTGHSTQSFSWTGPGTETLINASGPTWQNSYTSPSGTAYFPKARNTITHAGKVFVANTYEDGVAYPNRIRWSHPNNATNWAETDRIDINDGGTEITGMTSFAGHLVIFKKNAVFALFGYDSDTFQVVEISRSVGCVSSHSFVSTERGVYFFSYPSGLMLYNGERVLDLFEQLRPMFDLDYVNITAIDDAYVSYINRRIWLSLPYSETGTATEPSVSFVYDPSISQRGAWIMHATSDGFGLSGGCSFVAADGTTYNLGVHPTQPYVLAVDLFDQTQDNIGPVSSPVNTSFISRYRTKWFDAGNYSQKKMFRRPDLVVKQSSVDSEISVRVYRDYEEAEGSEIREYSVLIPASSSGALWGSFLWGSASWGSANAGSQLVKGRNMGLARSVQVEFEGPLAKKWGINSCTLKYSPRKVSV